MQRQTVNWESLLKPIRLKPEDDGTPVQEKVSLSPFEEDYAAYISSSVIRALQDKTQVFSVDSSDFTRTRLTHSLETASIARRISHSLFKKENKYRTEINDLAKFESDIASILETAGLLHDIGNPPFGHAGEDVLSRWIGKWIESNPKLIVEEKYSNDLRHVEGNAQAIRYLISDDSPIEKEMNPTYAVISVMMKYTICSSSYSDAKKNSSYIEEHKPGYYISEKEAVLNIFKTLDLPSLSDNGMNIYFRNPLTYLLEAADDIAYSTADFEDAFVKGFITLNELNSYEKIFSSVDRNHDTSKLRPDWTKAELNTLIKLLEECKSVAEQLTKIHSWIETVRMGLIYVAVWAFSYRYHHLCSGNHHIDLLLTEYSNQGHLLLVLKEFVHQYVHESTSIKSQQVLAEDSLYPFLTAATSFIKNGNTQDINEKEFYLLPSILQNRLLKLVEVGKFESNSELVYKELRTILDFVCLLTDSAAISIGNTYRNYFAISSNLISG